ncbi:MAG: response regulator transcription factor [Chloroflexi bacterium]|nr:response regulator transcription factor [Chloroflexota bacterium]
MMAKIRVVLVDDHTILREGLRSLLVMQEDIEVVGEAGDGAAALELIRQVKPDIVVMDVAMPGMDGLEATRRVKKDFPETRVLILTQHDHREYVFSLLQAGAVGYILKKSGGAEVINAIRSTAAEGAFLPPGIAREVMDRYIQRPQAETGRPHLTEREKQVLRLIAEGKTNKEIAEMLYLSVKTVMVHRTNIMEKLDIHSRTELVKYAIRQGMISV